MTDALLHSYVVKALLTAQINPLSTGSDRSALFAGAVAAPVVDPTSKTASKEEKARIQQALVNAMALAPHVLTRDVSSTDLSTADALYGTGRLNVVPAGIKSIGTYLFNPKALTYEETALFNFLAKGEIEYKGALLTHKPLELISRACKLLYSHDGVSSKAATLYGPNSGFILHVAQQCGVSLSKARSNTPLLKALSWITSVEIARDLISDLPNSEWNTAMRRYPTTGSPIDSLVTQLSLILYLLGQGVRYDSLAKLKSDVDNMMPVKTHLTSMVARKQMKLVLQLTRPVMSAKIIDYLGNSEHVAINLIANRHRLDAVDPNEDAAALFYFPKGKTELINFVKLFTTK